MASVNSLDLSIFNAKQFKESVSEPIPSNVYFTFGRVTPWNNEANPPTANTSETNFYDVWNNMIGAKRITGNDMRHCIPRFNWTANTVYTAYDNLIDSKNLKNANTQFYVITDEYRVYKCLSNNYGSQSTVKPIDTSTTSHFQTLDGYIWKYMYSLTSEDKLRFTTTEYIPVRTLELNDNTDQWAIQDGAISGGIHVINVTNGGDGYTTNNITITITGDGTDANAYAIRNVSTNTISSIIVDNFGSGYTFANVAITSNTGANAAARAIISPPGGHGSNPLYELGGRYLILDIPFNSDGSGKFIVNNDYRQITFIDSPKEYATGNLISAITVSQVMTLTLNGSSIDYVLDEEVYQGVSLLNSTFRGRVADWDSSNNVIKLTNVVGVAISDILTGTVSTAARFVDSVSAPDMQPYTGNLLYINNIQPIERSIDQNEVFQIVLKF